ncbi:MAG: ABC transporter permease [Acidobacteriota bacterium]
MKAEPKPRGLASNSLAQLTLVRFREFWREPEAVFWVFVFPILLAAGLGIAFKNRPAEAVKIGATDAAIASRLGAEKSLDVRVMDRARGDQALRTGRIVLLAMPDTAGGIAFRYDDTNPDARTARLLAGRAIERASGRPLAMPERDDLVRERGSRYIDFLIPGLLGMNLMGSGMWGIGFSIVDARRKKLLKRLIASPMSRAEYLLSFLLARLTLLSVEVVALLGFGHFLFEVPLRGSLTQLAAICLLSSLSFSALGLLVASRARTIEAASGLMNFVMLPMWIFSGVFFGAERFPQSFQPFIQALPLTAVNNALRANMLEGAPLAAIAVPLGIITVWLAASFFIALKLFRWR